MKDFKLLPDEKQKLFQAIDEIKMILGEQHYLIDTLNRLNVIIERQELDTGCRSCLNWKNPGCGIFHNIIPPHTVIRDGCKEFTPCDDIPF